MTTNVIISFIRHYSDEILLVYRDYKNNPTKFDNKTWGFVGGKANRLELATNAAIRETKEEIGCDISKEDLYLVGFQEKINGENHEIDFWYAVIVNDSSFQPKITEPDKHPTFIWTSAFNASKHFTLHPDFYNLSDNFQVFDKWLFNDYINLANK